MKVSISLPDEVFASAEALAARLGVSRSQLFATAVAEFLAKHRGRQVTARLNAVYSGKPSELDAALRRAQVRAVDAGAW
jgi:metal-responsive CopG/Arc/MetJ family transcriptional regulator